MQLQYDKLRAAAAAGNYRLLASLLKNTNFTILDKSMQRHIASMARMASVDVTEMLCGIAVFACYIAAWAIVLTK